MRRILVVMAAMVLFLGLLCYNAAQAAQLTNFSKSSSGSTLSSSFKVGDTVYFSVTDTVPSDSTITKFQFSVRPHQESQPDYSCDSDGNTLVYSSKITGATPGATKTFSWYFDVASSMATKSSSSSCVDSAMAGKFDARLCYYNSSSQISIACTDWVSRNWTANPAVAPCTEANDRISLSSASYNGSSIQYDVTLTNNSCSDKTLGYEIWVDGTYKDTYIANTVLSKKSTSLSKSYTISLSPGTHTLELALYNGNISMSSSKSFTVAAPVNLAPIVEAGPNQSVMDLDFVTVLATASDPEGNAMTYQWREGTTVLSAGLSYTGLFTVGTHVLTFTATDSYGNSTSDSLTITVNPRPVTTGDVGGVVRDSVTGAGVANVLVSGAGQSAYTDTSGNYLITSIAVGTYTFTVTGAPNYRDASSSISVVANTSNVLNFSLAKTGYPTVDAGPDQTVSKDAPATLSGTGSYSGGGTLSYKWEEDGTVLATTAAFTKVFAVGTHTLTFTVTNAYGYSNSDTVKVTVRNNTGSLSGKVTDENGRALAGAKISETMGKFEATTDSSGSFSIANIIEGIYQFFCELAGYISKTFPVEIFVDAETTQQVILSPVVSATGDLDFIIVDNIDGAPVVGVTVKVGALAGTTDNSGKVKFASLPSGNYNTEFSATGFYPLGGTIAVETGTAKTINITLVVDLSSGLEAEYADISATNEVDTMIVLYGLTSLLEREKKAIREIDVTALGNIKQDSDLIWEKVPDFKGSPVPRWMSKWITLHKSETFEVNIRYIKEIRLEPEISGQTFVYSELWYVDKKSLGLPVNYHIINNRYLHLDRWDVEYGAVKKAGSWQETYNVWKQSSGGRHLKINMDMIDLYEVLRAYEEKPDFVLTRYLEETKDLPEELRAYEKYSIKNGRLVVATNAIFQKDPTGKQIVQILADDDIYTTRLDLNVLRFSKEIENQIPQMNNPLYKVGRPIGEIKLAASYDAYFIKSIESSKVTAFPMTKKLFLQTLYKIGPVAEKVLRGFEVAGVIFFLYDVGESIANKQYKEATCEGASWIISYGAALYFGATASAPICATATAFGGVPGVICEIGGTVVVGYTSYKVSKKACNVFTEMNINGELVTLRKADSENFHNWSEIKVYDLELLPGNSLDPTLSPQTNIISQTLTTQTVSATSGGAVNANLSGNILSVGVAVPAGTLAKNTEITIGKVGESSIDLSSGSVIAGSVIQVKPENTVFTSPSDLKFTVSKEVGDRLKDVVVVYYNEANSSWAKKTETVITFDAVANNYVISAPIDHFSVYAVSGSLSNVTPTPTPTPASGDGGGGGGCFIATAAYGTPMAEEVVLLKRFRDQYLVKTGPGRWFVKCYYKYSPPVADFIRNQPWLKAATRAVLKPIIWLISFITG